MKKINEFSGSELMNVVQYLAGEFHANDLSSSIYVFQYCMGINPLMIFSILHTGDM